MLGGLAALASLPVEGRLAVATCIREPPPRPGCPRPGCSPPRLPPPRLHPHPASEDLQGPGGGAPGPRYTTGHLPEESGGGGAPAT